MFGMLGGDKPWYQSKSIIVGIVLAGLAFYKVEITPDLVKTITENYDSIAMVILSIAGIIGRIKATETITVAKKTEHVAEYVPPVNVNSDVSYSGGPAAPVPALRPPMTTWWTLNTEW